MKRSEILKVIKDSLYCHLPGYDECPDFIAETVLQSIEGAGMLPPVHDGDRAGMYEDGEWEPE